MENCPAQVELPTRNWTTDEYNTEKEQCIDGGLDWGLNPTDDLEYLANLLTIAKNDPLNKGEFTKNFLKLLKKSCQIPLWFSGKPQGPVSEQSIFHLLSKTCKQIGSMAPRVTDDERIDKIVDALHAVIFDPNSKYLINKINSTKLTQHVYAQDGTEKTIQVPILDFQHVKTGYTARQTAECNNNETVKKVKIKNKDYTITRFQKMIQIIDQIKATPLVEEEAESALTPDEIKAINLFVTETGINLSQKTIDHLRTSNSYFNMYVDNNDEIKTLDADLSKRDRYINEIVKLHNIKFPAKAKTLFSTGKKALEGGVRKRKTKTRSRHKKRNKKSRKIRIV
jgi:hypothetical protein